ncbi:MAG: hypothetical protein NT159_09025 [Proteobacteria bacterium]|nr:hypothetical protein [Pseudomonadota bacterium]
MFVSAHSHGAEERLSPVYDAALAGDAIKALAALSEIDVNTLSAEDAARAVCIRNAVLEPPRAEAIPPMSNSILLAYRTYWQQSMRRRVTTGEAEAQLKNRLDAILAAWKPAYASSDSLEVASERARQAVEHDGLFALTGVTSPYYELAIWKTQAQRTYSVKLHDRRVETQVVFLDDFVSFGWAGYATCDRFHTAGWATEKSLFAVKSAYDLASERFQVSYLAHESRHFSDYRRFPKLQQPELEYRAKLTELTLARASAHDLIATFARRAGRDRSVPHNFANYWVLRHLGKMLLGSDALIDDVSLWKRVPARDIRSAAKRLLTSNDASLIGKKPKSVERFLGD